jgi:NTP pyrophosphatase (non-canonical NTP hydrolase)
MIGRTKHLKKEVKMTLDEYQKLALSTASRKGEDFELAHRVLGLVGEAGEVAEKLKKIYRDKQGKVDDQFVDDLKKELGDVMWYIATLADFFDLKLSEIAQINVDKLSDRASRGKLGGSGDNR